MSVMRLRMHVAVTGGRKRLDTEVEIVDVSAIRYIRYRLVTDPVKERENRVEGDEHQCGPGDKGWPGRGHAPMADVRPEVETKPLRDDFPSTDPQDPRFRFLLARAGGHLI